MPRTDRSRLGKGKRAAGATPPTAVIRIGATLTLLDLVRERGMDPTSVIRRAGMSPEIFDDPDNLVPYVQLCRLAQTATEAANCEHFCLLAGVRLTIASLGLVGVFVQVHAGVGAALRSLAQYLHLHDRGAAVHLTVDEAVAILSYVVTEPAPGADLVCDGAAAVMCNIIKALAGPTWHPTEVLLPRTPPADSRPFTAFFKAPIRFAAGIAAVRFPGAWLDRPVHTGDAEFRRIVERWVTAIDDQRPGRFNVHVGGAIRTLVLTGKPTIENVAAACGVTGRALSRRLAREGTSLRKLLERTRFDLARQLLASSDQPIARIAIRLGYAEPAAFMHAFRRWSGTTPAEWRNAKRLLPVAPSRRTEDDSRSPDAREDSGAQQRRRTPPMSR